MSTPLKSNLLRRTAAVLSAAATFLIAGQASALTVTMSGAGTNAQCGQASMSVTPDGNVSVSCGSGTTTNATFTLSAPASLAPNFPTVNQIQVNRTGSSIDAINVPFSATGCTPASGQVTFAAGISTPQSIALTTPASGSCGIQLGAPSAPGVLGSPSSATIAIVDPDSAVTFTFTAASSATQIGAAASTLTVQRSGGSNGTWNVPYTVSGATTVATVGGTGTLSFAPGSSSATVTVTPAALVPAGVTLPAALTVTLGTPVQAAGLAGQLGSVISIPAHAVTVSVSSNCPALPANMLEAALGGPGNVLLQMQQSDQIVSIPLPSPPSGRYTAQITVGESAGGAYTPQPVTLEMSINKCRGKIDTNMTGTYCNLVTTNGSMNNIVWLAQAVGSYSSQAAVNLKGWCFAPSSEGQHYLNARWRYGSCAFGAAVCGFAMTYN